MCHATDYAGDPDSLLEYRLFFQLREALASGALDRLPMWRKLYFQAFTENFFHQPAMSNKTIGLLLTRYKADLDPVSTAKLLMKRTDNHIKLYEYRQAYETTQVLLKKYTTVLDSAETGDLKNSAIIWHGLQQTPAQITMIKADTRIGYRRDLAGLINIPVRFGDSSYDFVFDTGANLSVISESYAQKTRMRILNNAFDVRAITGLQVKARLGISEAFSIGDITVRNAVFIVFPDSALSFANGAYKINAILGFPVIEQLREIHIRQDKTMFIPANASDTALRNFGLDELLPVLGVGYWKDTLAFSFDTGAQQTFLNKPFYTRYRAMVDSSGQPFTMRFGGAGGSTSAPAFNLQNVSFSIGRQTALLKRVVVKTVSNTPKDTYYYGNMGQDVMRQFGEMVINFRYMYVKFLP
ncbi:MAG: retropepsin-like domain-containing protein [Bacteroidetes bacterium]|nr:retropepsin-like domain-containing protein [Bacteroidota bacterium]